MAPEVSDNVYRQTVSTRIGYGIEADIWSVGVMMFEFVCGYLPFAKELHPMKDSREIMKVVHETNLEFPKDYTDKAGRHLMRGLMRRDPAERMGTGPDGFAKLRDHEFFKKDRSPEFNLFDQILGRQLDSPYVAPTENYQIESDSAEEMSDADEFNTATSSQTHRNRTWTTVSVDGSPGTHTVSKESVELGQARRGIMKRSTVCSADMQRQQPPRDDGVVRNFTSPGCAATKCPSTASWPASALKRQASK